MISIMEYRNNAHNTVHQYNSCNFVTMLQLHNIYPCKNYKIKSDSFPAENLIFLYSHYKFYYYSIMHYSSIILTVIIILLFSSKKIVLCIYKFKSFFFSFFSSVQKSRGTTRAYNKVDTKGCFATSNPN